MNGPAAAPAPAGRSAAMPFIMITVLIDMVSIGLIVPVLPALVGSFTTSQTEQAWWYGAVTFAFSIANFISSPILGALSDRFGLRATFALSGALTLAMLVVARRSRTWAGALDDTLPRITTSGATTGPLPAAATLSVAAGQ